MTTKITSNENRNGETTTTTPIIGVLALQGAFQEHQSIVESLGYRTRQVKTASDLHSLSALILPGGESTAMGLIASPTLWPSIRTLIRSGTPTWGTCAGMILLADRCIGTSAVIENGQSLVGGMDILVCRNYFGSQISSFEMMTPPPPGKWEGDDDEDDDYPGVFIRAPAILTAGRDTEVLGRVLATPCRQAAVVLDELDKKIGRGEKVVTMGVMDAMDRSAEGGAARGFRNVAAMEEEEEEEKKDVAVDGMTIVLPGAAEGTNAREVICAVRKENVLCTAFHPELTSDDRWHRYFLRMVEEDCGRG